MRRLAAITISLLLVVGVAGGALAQNPEYRSVEEPFYGIGSVVPAGWTALGSGRYARGESPSDIALVAIQSVPGTIDELWPSLVPQFFLDQPPPSTGTHASIDREWTLYRFDVESPMGAAAIELALSEQDGSTGLVLLQTALDELDALRDVALVPAMDAFAPLESEPAADATSAGYASEDVVFPGGAEDVQLAATLTVPDSAGPHPAVVLVSGSGGQDRDETLPFTSLRPFAEIADALSSAGIAVLRYDDRGVADSTGERAGIDLDDITADAHAALDFLAVREEIDPERIGLMGHSEGGLVAARLGAEDPRLAFLISMAGPAVRGADALQRQNAAVLEAMGLDPAYVRAYDEFLGEFYPVAIAGDAETGRDMASAFFEGAWDLLDAEIRAQLGQMTREEYVQLQTDALVGQTIEDPAVAPWVRSFLDYDPGTDWATVTVPVLGLYGGKDIQVLSEQNEPALRARLAEAGNDDITTVVFEDANHLFQDAETGSTSEYASLAPEFTAEFLPTVVDWVVSVTGVAD